MPPAIDVARRFAEAVATLRALHDFDDWIGQYWRAECSAPKNAASTRAPLEAEDAIIWHEAEDTIFGYLPGYDGCFCIPRDVALPDFPFSAGRQSLSYDQDIVISAAMREEIQPPGS